MPYEQMVSETPGVLETRRLLGGGELPQLTPREIRRIGLACSPRVVARPGPWKAPGETAMHQRAK
jgi:hypothetical protein